MVVPSSALLDPWTDSYQQEMLKQEKLNRIQRRQGVWDASSEPEQNSGRKKQNSGRPTTHSGSGRRRHRRLRRRQKRSPIQPVHYGRGVHRSSHPEHFVTRYRIYQDDQEQVSATVPYSPGVLGQGSRSPLRRDIRFRRRWPFRHRPCRRRRRGRG